MSANTDEFYKITRENLFEKNWKDSDIAKRLGLTCVAVGFFGLCAMMLAIDYVGLR